MQVDNFEVLCHLTLCDFICSAPNSIGNTPSTIS